MRNDCIICGARTHRIAFQEFDVAVLRCTACGHLHSSYDLVADYDGYFADAALASSDLFWWDAAHDRMYRAFCRRFIAGRRGRLLDVGCGLGYFVRHVSSAYPDWEVSGYEMSGEAVRFARDTLKLTNVFRGRVEDSGLAPGSLDVITLWDVIEHIPDPDPLLAYLSTLLAPGGMLVMHTPNAVVQLPKARLKKMLFGMRKDIHYLEARDHAHVYSMRGLTTVLRRTGFRDVRYIHLPPIQSVAGAKSAPRVAAKNAWWWLSRAVHRLTFGAVNLDNLLVIAISAAGEAPRPDAR